MFAWGEIIIIVIIINFINIIVNIIVIILFFFFFFFCFFFFSFPEATNTLKSKKKIGNIFGVNLHHLTIILHYPSKFLANLAMCFVRPKAIHGDTSENLKKKYFLKSLPIFSIHSSGVFAIQVDEPYCCQKAHFSS